MKNKILATLILSIIMSFLFISCSTNDNSIDHYKETKIQEIQDYIATKEQENFSAGNRTAMNELAITCENLIKGATSKTEIDFALIDAKQKIDGLEPIQSEAFENGVYFITDVGFERYMFNRRDSAQQETKIEKQSLWLVKIDGQMTISEGNRTTYSVVLNGGIYRGISLVSYVDMWVSDNNLFIKNVYETQQFKLDKSYDVSSIAQTNSLAVPSEIEASSDTNGITLTWTFSDSYGYFGVGVEIKTAESTEFMAVKTERAYMNTIVVQLTSDQFVTGENQVRVFNIGGYRINKNKTVSAFLQSEYAVYNVIVAGDTIKVIK